MTQPSEEAIRKACEEAGVDANEFIALYQSAPGIVVNYPWMNAILALARRIEAEREAVPASVAAEIRSLREQVAQERADRQAAILEGMEIMREAAAEAYAAEARAWVQLPQRFACLRQGVKAIISLDTAAILAAHTRAKAMDELIAGDADLL